RVGDGKAVLVSDAPAHDESVVVEVEVAGIEEQDLAHLRALLQPRSMVEADAGRVRGVAHEVGKFLEDLGGREAVRLQDQFALQIAVFVDPPAVSVGTLDALGEPRRYQVVLLIVGHPISPGEPYRACPPLSRRPCHADVTASTFPNDST